MAEKKAEKVNVFRRLRNLLTGTTRVVDQVVTPDISYADTVGYESGFGFPLEKPEEKKLQVRRRGTMSCKHDCGTNCTQKKDGQKIPLPPMVSKDGLSQTCWPSCHYRVVSGDEVPWTKIKKEDNASNDEMRAQASG